MHLASEAVLAAGGSPFLDSALGSASGVLCCINLPAIGQQFAGAPGGAAALSAMQSPEGERHTTRMAAQAAAGALRSITGRSCDDFVLCVQPRPLAEAVGDGSTVQVEATLLVLRGPNPPGPNAPAAAVATPASRQAQAPAQAGQVGAPTAAPQAPPPRQQALQQGRLSSSTWSMLSAMAGGAAGRAAPPTSRPAPAAAAPAQAAPAQQQAVPAQSQAAPAPASPLRGAAPRGAAAPPAAAASRPAPSSAPSPQAAERVPVSDYLADSLTAQSLDLPPVVSLTPLASACLGPASPAPSSAAHAPFLAFSACLPLPAQAAKWRQGQRSERDAQRRLILWEVDETEPCEGEPPGRPALPPRAWRAPLPVEHGTEPTVH